MRCQDCNTNLTDEESTRKDERTNEYMDICNRCLSNLWSDTTDGFPLDNDDDLFIVIPDGDDHDGG